MKLYKTLIFIVLLLALLAGLCLVFPAEGVKVGPITLRFPNLQEVLGIGHNDEEEHVLTPEELLEQEMAVLMQAKDSTFTEFCQNSPIRISMPRMHCHFVDTLTQSQYLAMSDSLRNACDSLVMLIDNTPVITASANPDTLWVAYRDSVTDEREMTYLDDLFLALDSARSQHVRIVHYGDSQIEEDRITSGLREHFQAQFGGGGCGWLPAQQWVAKLTSFQNTQPELPYYVAYGTATMRAKHNGYGPMATVAHAAGNVRITYSMAKSDRFPHVRDFDRVSVLRNDPAGSGLIYQVQEFDTLQQRVTINIAGPADIYGVLLDQKTGVSMDNVPMRGSSGSIFSRIDRKTLTPFFEHENVQLIIMQYGGNMVPSMKGEQSLHDFCREIVRQIRFLQQMAPNAKVLFIGPSDMSTNVGGQMKTYPLLPQFVELLDRYVTSAGASFWNLYQAMGGYGSMVQWVAARPQLAGEDYVHFTHKGAEHVSDLLFETIDTYYNYYKFRRGELELELPSANEDSLTNDTLQPAADTL